MDRVIIYPGAIPLETDLLSAQRNIMIGLGYLAQATIGTVATVDGLVATPAAGSLGVVVGPGSIFQLATVDQSAFSSLSADPDPLVKIGINTEPVTFPLTAPAVAGQSASYLIEAAFIESDDSAVVVPYYNSANPAQPFSGPAGGGASQNTRRHQACQLQIKAGVAANTGTQALPAVDAGWVGLYSVTVNYGATSPVIAVLPNAPFVGGKLPGLAAALAAETARAEAAEAALQAELGVYQIIGLATTPGVYTWTAPRTQSYKITVTGGGGGSGGSSSTQAGGGGGAGGTSIAYVYLVAGQTVTFIVGGPGLAGSDTGGDGGSGGTSSFGIYISASGGYGGLGGQNGGTGGLGGAGTSAEDVAALCLFGGAGVDGSPGSLASGGIGGASFWGGGARGSTVDNIAESQAALGAGAGGAYYNEHGGGMGGAGLVMVEG